MTFNRVLPFLAALVLAAIAVQAVRTGRVTFGRRGKLFGPWTFRREQRPIAFWMTVSFYGLVAVFLCVFAFSSIR